MDNSEYIRKIIREELLRVNESRTTTYTSEILYAIGKSVPGLKPIASNFMGDGSEGLYRYEKDGNAYEIQIRPIEYANDKDNWKKYTAKKQQPISTSDDITPEEVRQVLWLAFKETADKISFVEDDGTYYKYTIIPNDTLDVANATQIGEKLTDRELGKYEVSHSESASGLIVLKYKKGTGIKKVFSHILATA